MTLRLLTNLLCIMWLISPLTSIGQPAEQEAWRSGKRLPNDTELKASYCLAVVAQSLAYIQKDLSVVESWDRDKGSVSDVAVAMRKNAADARSSMRRLEAYLEPREPYLDSAALLSAYEQGRVDYSMHASNSKRELCWDACFKNNSDAEAKRNACFAACDAVDPVTNRVLFCFRASSLPY